MPALIDQAVGILENLLAYYSSLYLLHVHPSRPQARGSESVDTRLDPGGIP